LVAFIIAHVYLITTGRTATSNLKAMITGYEETPEGETLRNNVNERKGQVQEGDSDLLS
jgi:hypothetical protein